MIVAVSVRVEVLGDGVGGNNGDDVGSDGGNVRNSIVWIVMVS